MSAAGGAKRTRCTKRITSSVDSEENLAPDVHDTDMLYSTTVARHWNSHSVSSKGGVKCNTPIVEHLDKGRERTPLKEYVSHTTDGKKNSEPMLDISRRSKRICISLSGTSVSSYKELSGSNTVLNIKDPTPPSTPDHQLLNVRPRTAKLKRSVETAIKRLERMQSVMEPNESHHYNDDGGRDGGDCVEILEPQFASEQGCGSHNLRTTVKIRSLKSGILKYDMLSIGCFSEVIKYLSGVEQVKPESINLYLRDRKLREYETPKSVSLGVADIIECYIRTGSTSSSATDTGCVGGSSAVTTKNSIQLCVQFGAKSKITMSIAKNEPMGTLMSEFCKGQGHTMSDVSFMFDGEPIDAFSTPNSLDLEDDFCIDAIVYTNLD